MTDTQNAKLGDAKCWLELANGGGVMFRDPSVTAPPEPPEPPPPRVSTRPGKSANPGSTSPV